MPPAASAFSGSFAVTRLLPCAPESANDTRDVARGRVPRAPEPDRLAGRVARQVGPDAWAPPWRAPARPAPRSGAVRTRGPPSRWVLERSWAEARARGRVRPSVPGVEPRAPHGVSDFTAKGDCAGSVCLVAGTPLRPHVATPAELRERLRAEAAGAPFLVLRDEDDRQVDRRARGRPRAAHDRARRGDRRGAGVGRARVAHARDARAAGQRLDDRRRRPLAQRDVGQRGARDGPPAPARRGRRPRRRHRAGLLRAGAGPHARTRR